VSDRIAQVLGVGEALASDASWAVRRLLEVLASERPLVVVLEDLHWAEPPMLDLADAVIERVHGPVLFLCLARPELLEQRPTWSAGKPRTLTTALPPLSPADSRRVAELLLGAGAPTAVVDRVCETAEGNPLYLEQLTAMLTDRGLLVDGHWVEGDDADVEIPETLQALLAARLDRLEPLLRLILERASVEGRRFRIAALRPLAPEVSPDEVVGAIASLERKGLVQPENEARGRWRFAHALVLEAAYRGLSKELRADLHERLADWMMEEDAEQADVDESVARHLERALHLREELGARDEGSAALSERAGELFADAGSRAFAALDYITSRDLLGRAAVLLPEQSPRRLDLLPNLGAALADSGRAEEAEALLTEAIEGARAVGSERDALRATVQLLSSRIYRSPTEAEVESAAEQARSAADAFEELADDDGLAETAIALDNLGYMRGRMAEATLWTSKALRHALAAGRPREATQAAGDMVGIMIVGPLPFDRFAATARELLSSDEPMSNASGYALMAVAALAAGDDGGFDEHEGRWRDLLDRHGLAWLAAAHGMEIAFVETSVGRAEAAERRIRDAREFFAAIGNLLYTSVADEFLCEAVAAQDRPREFLRLADAFGATVPIADRQNLIKRQLVLARTHLLRGSAPEAEAAAGGRSSSWSQPTWCPITPTPCSCSPMSSTRVIWMTTRPWREAGPSRSSEAREISRRSRAGTVNPILRPTVIPWAQDLIQALRDLRRGTLAPCRRRSPHDPIETPAVGNALQLVLAGVFEGETGASHQVLHGLRDAHLGCTRGRGDPSSDRHGDAPDLAVDQFALARVHAGADLDPEVEEAVADLDGAADCACRPIKRCVEAISHGI
jgi:tetratricopeptide (TPR) repeat protein